MIDSSSFYPYWAGRLSGFVRVIPRLYKLPEEVQKEMENIIAEYDKEMDIMATPH